MSLKLQDISCQCITHPCNCGKFPRFNFDNGVNPVQPKIDVNIDYKSKPENELKLLKAKTEKEKNKKIILYVAVAVAGFFAYKKLFKK